MLDDLGRNGTCRGNGDHPNKKQSLLISQSPLVLSDPRNPWARDRLLRNTRDFRTTKSGPQAMPTKFGL